MTNLRNYISEMLNNYINKNGNIDWTKLERDNKFTFPKTAINNIFPNELELPSDDEVWKSLDDNDLANLPL